jgi:hypothetical protein
MNERQVMVKAWDVTGQRHAQWPAPASAVFAAILGQAVSQLRLPTEGFAAQPIIYNGYDDAGGELIPADDTVETVLQRFRLEAVLAVRVIPELEAAAP